MGLFDGIFGNSDERQAEVNREAFEEGREIAKSEGALLGGLHDIASILAPLDEEGKAREAGRQEEHRNPS